MVWRMTGFDHGTRRAGSQPRSNANHLCVCHACHTSPAVLPRPTVVNIECGRFWADACLDKCCESHACFGSLATAGLTVTAKIMKCHLEHQVEIQIQIQSRIQPGIQHGDGISSLVLELDPRSVLKMDDLRLCAAS